MSGPDSLTRSHIRAMLRDVVILTLLCAVCYGIGMNVEGLAGWQESQRALVAREMLDNREWVVPTRNGEPYLAKPPLIYWCQMTIASLRGSRVTEFDLRLTVALAGWLGVLVTYFAAGRVLRDAGSTLRFARAPAIWTAIGLATGVLYLRSSRTGELDVLLVPSITLVVWAVFEAWSGTSISRLARFGWIVFAAFAAGCAALTKGPPAIATLVIGAYGSILMYESVFGPEARQSPSRKRWQTSAKFAAIVSFFGVLVWKVRAISDVFDDVILATCAALAAWAIVRVSQPHAIRRWLLALARTHPLIVIGASVAALWGWGRFAAARIGADAVRAIAEEEMNDNLLIFFEESAANNLGFIAYGLGAMSALGLFGLWCIIAEPSRATKGRSVALTWFIGGFLLMSLAGKGVARYLTPIWPALAMLAAVGISVILTQSRAAHRQIVARLILAVLFISALIQIYWYAYGRPHFYPGRSPRDLARELTALQVDASRIGTWGFDEPALEFYLGHPATEWDEGRRAEPVARLIDDIKSTGRGYIMLVREETPRLTQRHGSFFQLIDAAGLESKRLPIRAPYVRYQTDSNVDVIQIDSPSVPEPTGTRESLNSTDDTDLSPG